MKLGNQLDFDIDNLIYPFGYWTKRIPSEDFEPIGNISYPLMMFPTHELERAVAKSISLWLLCKP